MREIIEKKGEDIGEGTERKGRDDEKCVKASKVNKKMYLKSPSEKQWKEKIKLIDF